ncbi:hypothetical protein [Cohaesibacter celericrescens]|uniref:Uncharacterized protein n=1 Tax=Cohaesibacter celericrescens TaxID=2067669 RepID=A0A2N5XMC2_9HYPH|nr:hypothetical protein [Cohaesibacter celericrescens]PLW75635.1 hypothetical protein C0081_18470 [Cohaesibacter celericrescens]
MNIVSRALLIASFIAPIIGSVVPASAMTNQEWQAYKRDCAGRGGTAGVHADGSPGCHIGAIAKVKKGFKTNVSPSRTYRSGSGAGKANFQDLSMKPPRPPKDGSPKPILLPVK